MSTLKLTPFPSSSPFLTHNRITAGDLTLNSEEDVRAFALQLIRTPDDPRPRSPTAASPSLLPPTAHSPFPTPPLSPPLPELADGTDLEELIFDFLGTDRSMQDLCVTYEITPEELETLITSPQAQATIATLRRLELLRAKLQQRNALNDAMVTLTNIANDPKARPETARKSAAAIAKYHTPKPPPKSKPAATISPTTGAQHAAPNPAPKQPAPLPANAECPLPKAAPSLHDRSLPIPHSPAASPLPTLTASGSQIALSPRSPVPSHPLAESSP